MSNGTLWDWGKNTKGQLGDGTTAAKSSPVQIGTLSQWSMLDDGGQTGVGHSLGIKSDSTLWAWGMNDKGQLGDGTTTDKSSPVQIGTLAVWASIRAGTSHTIAVKTDSTLWSWGSNGTAFVGGGLGDGTTISKSSPIQIGTLATWSTMIAAAYQDGFAIKTDKTLWSWGYTRQGQGGTGLGGIGVSTSSPAQVGTLANWAVVSSRVQNQGAAAVKTDGTLWQWGTILNGGNTGLSSPVQIGTLATWSTVSVGAEVAHAIKTDSTLWAFGYAGTSGEMGDGTTVGKSSPVQIGTLATWNSVSNGNKFSVATKTDSTLWAWGLGTGGQLGDNTAASKSSPVQIGTTALWTAPVAGGEIGMAIQTAAAVVTANGGFFNFF